MVHAPLSGRCVGIVLILAVLLTGCSSMERLFWRGVESEISGDDDRSAEQKSASSADPGSDGKQSRSGGPSSGPQWNRLMITQARMAFSYAFSAGGLWAGQVGYEPGDMTKFKWSMEKEVSIAIERAYLKELDNGNQWWRVSWDDSEGLWIWEALINPQTSQMLRMRARDPDGNEGEVPVSGESVYMPASELTSESVQGATVDKGKVVVPAGTFQADHVVYMAPGADGNAEFWLSPQVPGGVVKYLVRQKGQGNIWISELLEYGKKATTVLKSF